MGAIVMDGARIGARSIVAAGALVTKGSIIPPGSLVMGTPAKVVRQLPLEEQSSIRGWAEKYIRVAAEHHASLEAAAEEWREITMSIGLESQKSAYSKSLGLEP